jgi:FAD/FMN-containing dehydrogenase/Fe-S oxidoreductase
VIPRLATLEPIDRAHRAYLAALRPQGFTGDIEAGQASRVVASTDNSVYQLLPQAVIFPRDAADVSRALRLAAEPAFRGVSLTPRGGGTGTNGQSLTEGIVLDLSRHLNQILEVSVEGRWARVQPGVVLDQLNAELAPHRLFFAPNLSPSNRATLGGMIATDACGQGSRVYGRTSQHLLGLELVLSDGMRWTSEPLSAEALEPVLARDDRVGAVYRTVVQITRDRAGEIAARFPGLQRFLTGYNLAMLRDPQTGALNLNYLVAGSEGTLAVVTEARLRLTPIPRHKRLVLIRYASFEEALASGEAIAASQPSAIETIDETVLELAKGDVIWHEVGSFVEGTPSPGQVTRTINLVEYAGDDPEAIARQVAALESAYSTYVARDAGEAGALWELRKKGVGLLGNTPGPRTPVPFVEDTVVPPERLAAYVRDFRALLDAKGLRYGMFGHIDVGCLHVRPALDLQDPADERVLREVSDAVAELVRRYGGVMWGEHGRGFRSEYGPQTFGEPLYQELRRIKAAFDPDDRLNPGKIARPEGSPQALVSVDGPKRGWRDRQVPKPLSAELLGAVACNGNAACLSVDPDDVMCPSSKVTRDRVHSPKGRAGVMREWLRQLGLAGMAAFGADARKGGRLGWFRRRWHGIERSFGRYDYSHEVYRAMAGCLACKACATQCPVRVDVPAFRAEFLAAYHGRYPRPAGDLLVGVLEHVVAWMGRFPRASNALFLNPLSRWLLEKLAGIVDTPRLSSPPVSRLLAAPQPAARGAPLGRVVLLQDAFTSFYEAPILVAVRDLLALVGFEVEVAPYRPSGKALHVKGFLARFERLAARRRAWLAGLAEGGARLVGIDPAVTLAYRDEYRVALGPGASLPRVALLQELLLEHRDRVAALAARPEGNRSPNSAPYVLMPHCTERTAVIESSAAWQSVFLAAGLELEVVRVGCCGMCGAYGHERAHLPESRGIFEMSWARRLPSEAASRARVVATGHSCRHQVHRFAGFLPCHPAQVLLEALAPGNPRPSESSEQAGLARGSRPGRAPVSGSVEVEAT